MHFLIIFTILIIETSSSLEINGSNGDRVECYKSKIDHNVTLTAGHQAGSFLKANKSIGTMDKCLQQCCSMNGCDVAFFSNGACYSVLCKNIQSCAPTTNLDRRMEIAISYVAKPSTVNNKVAASDKTGEPAITDNLVSEVTKESPFLFDDPSGSQDEDDGDQQLIRSNRENWKETKDMVLAIGCGFVAVAVGVAGVIMMTRQLVEDDDIFIDFETDPNKEDETDRVIGPTLNNENLLGKDSAQKKSSNGAATK